ncbi:fluoride efflux transporter CrcB [Actinopolymorpha alba]|uniref:fluoride efflux transporter CrcB n=1 Tax=Actinopolymorpha alba TaxID=533267 RepID=UPI0003A35165|nr:fluoride efflux transporter CrcB [Actinopolymorpha alba]
MAADSSQRTVDQDTAAWPGRFLRRLRFSRRLRFLTRFRALDTTLVIAIGGALGALARYGLTLRIPHGSRGFPWSTFLTNVSGCFAIGILMVVILDLPAPHRLLRPFVGIGILGGFTTFSTYAIETRQLLQVGEPATAAAYLFGTLAAALLAVWCGARGTRLFRQFLRRSR